MINPQQFDANATVTPTTLTQLHLDDAYVPHGGLLGQWQTDDWDCAQKDRTGYCKRRYSAREWSNRTMRWSDPHNLSHLHSPNNTVYNNATGQLELVGEMDEGRYTGVDGQIFNPNDLMLRISEDACHDCVGSWRSAEWTRMDNNWKGNIYTTETKEMAVYSMRREDVPVNALLGAWDDHRWVCIPGTGYCRRRFSAYTMQQQGTLKFREFTTTLRPTTTTLTQLSSTAAPRARTPCSPMTPSSSNTTREPETRHM